jgi:hypothetical protein
MFASLGLFSQVPCPEGDRCSLLQCLFSHSQDRSQGVKKLRPQVQRNSAPSEHTQDEGVSAKRRRLEYSQDVADVAGVELSRVSHQGRQERASHGQVSALDPRESESLSRINTSSQHNHERQQNLQTSKKPISPPPVSRAKPRTSNFTESEPAQDQSLSVCSRPNWYARMESFKVPESLNPRIVPKSPGKYDFRSTAIQKMHSQHQRFYEEHVRSAEPQYASLILSPLDLIKLALEEEEKYARGNAAVYNNVIRTTLMSLIKMDVETWRKYVLENMPWLIPIKLAAPSPKSCEAGLTESQQLAILHRLQAQDSQMDSVGYVRTEPSEEDIGSAIRGSQAAQGWEVCERCQSRFQVFPGRREEDGALTTGGPCRYHWGKLFMSQKDAIQKASGHSERTYTCCNEAIGVSSGCTKAERHVFKISGVKRLASILQFEHTPENDNAKNDEGVCIDCEMGYTVYGLELIRLTATSWPSGEEMIDVLVRPVGEVLDLNTRFSGVIPLDLANAVPYQPGDATNSSTDRSKALQLVSSPAAARDLLCTRINPKTFIIGHALENDLSVLRLIHCCIIDTAFLFPHPRPLPIRNSLKYLMSKFLDKNIQVNDAGQGHDSKEDARAAGELVSWKVAKEWKNLERLGWTIGADGKLVPPEAKKTIIRSSTLRGSKADELKALVKPRERR